MARWAVFCQFWACLWWQCPQLLPGGHKWGSLTGWLVWWTGWGGGVNVGGEASLAGSSDELDGGGVNVGRDELGGGDEPVRCSVEPPVLGREVPGSRNSLTLSASVVVLPSEWVVMVVLVLTIRMAATGCHSVGSSRGMVGTVAGWSVWMPSSWAMGIGLPSSMRGRLPSSASSWRDLPVVGGFYSSALCYSSVLVGLCYSYVTRTGMLFACHSCVVLETIGG